MSAHISRTLSLTLGVTALAAGCGSPALPAAPPSTTLAAAAVRSTPQGLAGIRMTTMPVPERMAGDRMTALPIPTVALRTVMSGVSRSSHVRHDRFQVFTTAEQAAQALAPIAPGSVHILSKVDFSRKELLLVALGKQQSGMVRVEISGVEDFGDRLHVQSIRFLPATHYPTMDMACPYDLVAIGRSTKPVEFAPVVDIGSPAQTRHLGSAAGADRDRRHERHVPSVRPIAAWPMG